MWSRDNFPQKSQDNDEDRRKYKIFDNHQRGNGRRNNFYTRHELRRNYFYARNQPQYNSNDQSFSRKSFKEDNKEGNVLSWRKKQISGSRNNQRDSLVNQIHKCQYECMICFVNIELDVAIWSCESCYHIFHINCIKKWSKTCGNDNSNTEWRCPACQKQYSLFADDILYLCFCTKMKNPPYSRGIIPHSCGNACGKNSKNNSRCPHLCSLLCHPGPCPPCDASLKCNCYCGNSEFIVKCSNSESNLTCGEKCNKPLNCNVHICQEICHANDCNPCNEVILQKCCCEKETREVFCGSSESQELFYSCNNLCSRLINCGLHKCERECHPGLCAPCQRLPENTRFCACGKTSLIELVESKSIICDRQSCVDPIPSCGDICDKPYNYCDHKCGHVCHENECPPCELTSNVKCRCNKTSQNMKCSEVARIMSMGEVVKCTTRCKSKKLCGIHRCQDTCCDIQVHVCLLTCAKLLSCKKHNCQRPCHNGNCKKCDNVSFDELFCECGATNILPPIECGQALPSCSYPCTREHACDHEMTHTCHSDPQCPPCTVLTSKECPGAHKVLYNIPCFLPVVTCGLVCNKHLPNCDHLCIKKCHAGDCTDDLFICTQLCTKPRTECGHPCNAPCHSDDCALYLNQCLYTIDLFCSCGVKSAHVTCDKFEKMKTMLHSNGMTNKRDTLEFCFSDKGNAVTLLCDNDCKKAARSKQLSEAFESESFTFDHVIYSSFLRDFSIANPDFLIQIDTTLCSLVKKLELEKLKKTNHRFTSMNREKRRFIQEMCEHFALTVQTLDPGPNCTITVDAVKGLCKIPNHRLIHFIQKNYPLLFRNDKPTSLKNMKMPPTDIPYMDKMKRINSTKKS